MFVLTCSANEVGEANFSLHASALGSIEVMTSGWENVIKRWHLAGMLMKVRGFPVESSAPHTATLPFQKVLEPGFIL